MTLVFNGKQLHKIFGSVDTYLDKDSGNLLCMANKCPDCMCNNVLIKYPRGVRCVDCDELYHEYNARIRHIQNYNDTHNHIASDYQYKTFEALVNDYRRRRDAGLFAPSNLDQALYMIDYWRRNKNGM